jgi:hypothetical protein
MNRVDGQCNHQEDMQPTKTSLLSQTISLPMKIINGGLQRQLVILMNTLTAVICHGNTNDVAGFRELAHWLT